MYLESIFIGGDIRSQLPEEARKFDEIDKTFKKVTFFKNVFKVLTLYRDIFYIGK